MKRNLLLSLVFMLTVVSAFSQNPLWIKTSADRLSGLEKTERSSVPKEYQLFQLDYDGIKSQLAAAPTRNADGLLSPTILAFPNAQGELENYRIYESSVMEAELAVQHPEIQSYVGIGIDNPRSKIHLTTTIFGLHVMVLSNKGTIYIDPYTKDLKSYIVYNKSSLSTARVFQCKTPDFSEEGASFPAPPPTTFANDGLFRTYRLAMTCTIEYAAYHVNAAGLSGGTLAQKKAAVLAAMNVTVARVNSVYENDMSLRMVLVANNSNIIFIDSDNYTNEDDGFLIAEGAAVINTTIGPANYDIGHTVSTSGSGLASLAVVCTSNKGRGTTGSGAPVGDPFDIDYVAHEMGHQFGAEHTQNNAECNKSFEYSMEPGTGSTIMGYAGLCAPSIQNNSDAYFHAISIENMVAHVTGSGNCASAVPSGNIAAVITPLMNRTIPVGTAFVLRGTATGPVGAELEYCWEQMNNGGANSSAPAPGITASIPNFRSLPPSESPNRYMPSLASVLNGNLAPTWEVIPNVARTMNFALTVRNNTMPNGGQTSRQNMIVNFSAAAGPFVVTSQNTAGISWNPGETHTITWNVANTTAAPISTANVNILLTTDGGETFTVLVANTPNDGSQPITVPNILSPNCRIMVEAVGNIFYALNPTPFAIGYTITTTCNTYNFNAPFAIPDGVPNSYTVRQIVVPDNVVISDVNATFNITHTWLSDVNVVLQSPNETFINLFNFGCSNNGVTDNLNATFDDQGTLANCVQTVTGNILPAEALSAFNGENSQGSWLVGVRDVQAPDSGTVQSFSLTICSQEAVMNTEDFGIKNLIVSPNPNKGNFKIQFDSVTGSDINVGVYDIGGRQIFNHNYSNTGLFSQDIQLGAVQSGIYLVDIQDGDKKETRKIIVE